MYYIDRIYSISVVQIPCRSGDDIPASSQTNIQNGKIFCWKYPVQCSLRITAFPTHSHRRGSREMVSFVQQRRPEPGPRRSGNLEMAAEVLRPGCAPLFPDTDAFLFAAFGVGRRLRGAACVSQRHHLQTEGLGGATLAGVG